MYKTKKYYEADKQYYRDNAKRRRIYIRELVNNIKDVPCADCGNKFPPYVMDFDHRGDKVLEVSKLMSLGKALDTILNEISKCDIVCSNCHRIRTHDRLN